MPTALGWDYILPPPTPAPQSIEFTAVNSVAVNPNPFTGQQQFLDWRAAWLEASVSMPPLRGGDVGEAEEWIAFLMRCGGQRSVFQFGDPLRRTPRGSGSGTPVVNGNNQTGYTLATRGWTFGAQSVLLAGDWFQMGFRLHRNLGTVNAGGGGAATLNIWPPIRESPTDNDALILIDPKGLFRMKSNLQKWSIPEVRYYGMQFEIREAL